MVVDGPSTPHVMVVCPDGATWTLGGVQTSYLRLRADEVPLLEVEVRVDDAVINTAAKRMK